MRREGLSKSQIREATLKNNERVCSFMEKLSASDKRFYAFMASVIVGGAAFAVSAVVGCKAFLAYCQSCASNDFDD